MKKYLLLMFVAVLPLLVMSAAPTFQPYYHQVGDVVVDSNTNSNWQPVGTLFVTASDSGFATLMVTGTAHMNPWERMYLGFGNDSANRVDSATSATTGQVNSNLDTNLVRLHPTVQGDIYLPFAWEYVVSMDSAQVDTFFFNIATGGGGEHVEVFDLVFSAQISDRD